MQNHFHKLFHRPGHTGFLKDNNVSMLLSLMRQILRHPLSVIITGFIPLRQKHLWDLMLKVLGLLSVYSDYCYIYFILSFDTVLVLFWFLRWEIFMTVVNDVISVVITMDSSILGVPSSLLIIFIFVYCYCYYDIISYIITYMGIAVTINY